MVEEIWPLEALKRSWALSRAHQLAIFGGLLPIWLLSGSLAIGAVLPFLDLSSRSVDNPFRNLATASIALTSALSWCASTIGVVLLTTLETVVYAQIAEQNHTEVFGQVAIPESDPGTV